MPSDTPDHPGPIPHRLPSGTALPDGPAEPAAHGRAESSHRNPLGLSAERTAADRPVAIELHWTDGHPVAGDTGPFTIAHRLPPATAPAGIAQPDAPAQRAAHGRAESSHRTPLGLSPERAPTDRRVMT